MKSPRTAAAALGVLVTLAACGQPATTTSTTQQIPSPASPSAAAQETTVTGYVVDVEDGGYPQFTVTLRPQGASEDLSLYLNAEDADLGGQTADSFKGKTVSVRFATTPDNTLSDLRRNGRSLMDAPVDTTAQTVTGTLSGAATPTAGDLPDTISVTDAHGKRTDFEYFVTPEIAAANGQQVTAYFDTRTLRTVRAMTAN